LDSTCLDAIEDGCLDGEEEGRENGRKTAGRNGISGSYTKVGGMQARVTRSLKPRLLQTECRLICKEVIERHFSIIAMGSCLSQGQSC